MNAERRAECLRALFAAGVEAVGGKSATERALQSIELGSSVRLLAFGKAADAMVQGALPVLGSRLSAGLLVTKYGHLSAELTAHPQLECLEASHPVPDEASLAAGEAVCRFAEATADNEHLLVLISGGGSALVESLIDGLTLADLQEKTEALLAGGADIGQINHQRRQLSRIKGGGLLGLLGQCRVTQLLISDVPGDTLEDIASGPLIAGPLKAREAAIPVETHVIASNTIAREAVATRAKALGLRVTESAGSLYGDVEAVADRFRKALPATPGDLVIFGGEPTLVLPAVPGLGGRNQHLAALMARRCYSEYHLAVLVCGTDGTDGPTDAAGGLIDSNKLQSMPLEALDSAIEGANTGRWLEDNNALVRTGPTGTNVMDLALALRGSA